MNDAGRIAVITGATAGIGAATARVLAPSGYRIVATGRRADRLKTLEAQVVALGGDIVSLPADVNSPGVVIELFQAAQERWGAPPDSFVLCAGRGLPGTLITSDESRWEEIFRLNYLAVARQLRDCATAFVRQAECEHNPRKKRDIVVIGSTVGRLVSSSNPVYGSTKFAVHSLVESLRQEVCSLGIRVTVIEPGFVVSEFQQSAGYDPEWFTRIVEDSGPLLEPADVARTVEFVMAMPGHVHVDDIRIRPTRQRS